ncbi:hypothetical protein [Natranaerofaba carboxydovora]|nr:hypothetical protein [Natranaerofaba carboxydovora]
MTGKRKLALASIFILIFIGSLGCFSTVFFDITDNQTEVKEDHVEHRK